MDLLICPNTTTPNPTNFVGEDGIGLAMEEEELSSGEPVILSQESQVSHNSQISEACYVQINEGSKSEQEDNTQDISSSEPNSSSVEDSSTFSGESLVCSSYEFDPFAHVLVLMGCKSCFMYFMVKKDALDCPRCSSADGLIRF